MISLRRLLLLVVIGLLSGCSNLIPHKLTNDYTSDTEMGLSQNLSSAYHSLAFEQLQTKSDISSYQWGEIYQVVSLAFDVTMSGSVIDDLIANKTRYELWSDAYQPQLSTNVVSRAVSVCYLNATSDTITWDSDMSGLVYHVRQWGSGRRALEDGQSILFGDQNTLAITIKNPTANLIQFSGSADCGPISPYGYARWYITRPTLHEFSINYVYKDQKGSGMVYNNLGYNIDLVNLAQHHLSEIAYPIGAIIDIVSLQSGNAIVSGSIHSGDKQIAILQGTMRIDTNSLGSGRYLVALQDQWGSIYYLPLVLYSRLDLTSITVHPDSQKRGYYHGFKTQSLAITIDTKASNTLLKQAYSGVTIADGVWFNECYEPHCFAFDVKIQSGQSVRQVTVVDQFGITGSIDLNFTMGAIKDTLQRTTIRGEGINMLTYGIWDNAIQVDYENIPGTTLNYRACQRKPEQDLAAQITDHTQKDQYNNNFVRLEDMLFVCDQQAHSQSLTSATKRYWDPQTATMSVPMPLQSSKAFVVSTARTPNATQLFVQSQIGMYVKQGAEKAYVWLFDLASGKQITGLARLQFYQFDSKKGWSSSGHGMVNERPYVIDTASWGDLTALTAQIGDDWGFVTLGGKANQPSYWTQDRSINLQSAISVGDVADSRTTQPWGYAVAARMYGYTDRGLYKPGDKLFVAGWKRAMTDIGQSSTSMSGSTVQVELISSLGDGTKVATITGIVLDAFGGFSTSIDLPATMKLGDYMLLLSDGESASYSQTIKVNEYQKPSFFIDQKLAWDDDTYRITLKPEYYFGAGLKSWQFKTDWSVVTKDRGWRWRDDLNQQDYYYDLRLEYTSNTTSLAGTIAGGGADTAISRDILLRKDLPSDPVTIKVASAVTDSLSNETHVAVHYETINPLVSIGLGGNPYDRYYASTIKQLKAIPYQLSGSRALVDRVTYIWYHFDWKTQSTSKGIDGSLYYNGIYYNPILSGTITARQNTIPVTAIDTPGDWLLVVQAWDKNNQEIGHNEKSIWYADGDGYNFGSLNNNYTLTVSIDQKQYDENEQIPINITPYIKGATVLITVEQGDRILDSYIRVLDGGQITIPAKKTYYPSAMISVTQVAGSDLLNQSSSGTIRREPRMWQGYGQVKLNQQLFALTVDIKTDKQQYQPGEQVTLTVTTTDYKGKAVDARLSVGVVDKSLNDLYAYFKSPLSDFFLSLGTTLTNYTNMKWIYQGLKVFNQEGSKGGGGGGRNPLGFLRQSFEDVAYWRGGIYTKNGVRTTTFTLPDNLTTWTVDVIGISKDSKVGTKAVDIIATKDLIVEPNLPLYLTIGDRLDVPVRVLGITEAVNKLKNREVTLSGSITTHDGQVIARIDQTAKLNEFVTIPVSVDPKWYQYEEIIVTLDARIGSYRDISRHSIPLRSEGLTQYGVKTSIEKQGSLSVDVPATALDGQVQVTLGQMPLLSLEHQFDYLIHYPYAGVEQTVSSIVGLLTAQSLTKYTMFSGYFNGDLVTPPYASSFSIEQAVQDAKTMIWKYQRNGGFVYWQGGKPDYMLSVYVYAAMLTYPQLAQGYEAKMTELERYLESNGGASNPDQYLYYLYHKAIHRGGVNLAQVQQLVESNDLARVAPYLLGAAIAQAVGDQQLATTWFDKLSLDDFDGRQSEYGPLYPLLTPRSALAIYQKLIPTLAGNKASQLSQELIVSLIRMRGSDGLWGYSTVDNLAALQILGVYHSQNRTTVTCSVTYGGQQQQFTITTGATQLLTLSGAAGQKLNIERSCSDTIVVDALSSYLSSKLSEKDLSSKDVEYLQWILPASLEIGQMSQAIAQFKITQSSPHTAIAFYIPSIYKLSDIVNTKNIGYDMPFVVEGSWSCRPTYYEVKFDQLFLYYDVLEPNQSCRISIPVLKAYSGDTVAMPSKLWQLYDDSVYTSVLPVIK